MCWTWTTRLSPGSTYAAIRATDRIGRVASAWCRFPAGGCDVAEDPDWVRALVDRTVDEGHPLYLGAVPVAVMRIP